MKCLNVDLILEVRARGTLRSILDWPWGSVRKHRGQQCDLEGVEVYWIMLDRIISTSAPLHHTHTHTFHSEEVIFEGIREEKPSCVPTLLIVTHLNCHDYFT